MNQSEFDTSSKNDSSKHDTLIKPNDSIRQSENGDGRKRNQDASVAASNGIKFAEIPQNMDEKSLAIFRTHVCMTKKNADSTGIDCSREGDCPYSHCLSWQRRNPCYFEYLPQMCPQLNLYREGGRGIGHKRGALKVTNACNNGQRCRYSHTKEEQLYHPQVYKTKICKGWKALMQQKIQRGEDVDSDMTEDMKNAIIDEDLTGTVPCHKFYCPFAHGTKEMRTTKGRQSFSQQSKQQTGRSDGPQQAASNSIDNFSRRKQIDPSAVRPTLLQTDKPGKQSINEVKPTRSSQCMQAPISPDFNTLNDKRDPSEANYYTNSSLNGAWMEPHYLSYDGIMSQENLTRNVNEGHSPAMSQDQYDKSNDRFWFNYKGVSFPATLKNEPRHVNHDTYEATVTFRMQIPSSHIRNLSTSPVYPVVQASKDPWNNAYQAIPLLDPTTFFHGLGSMNQCNNSSMLLHDLRSVGDFSRLQMSNDGNDYFQQNLVMIGGAKSIDQSPMMRDVLSQGGARPSLHDAFSAMDIHHPIRNGSIDNRSLDNASILNQRPGGIQPNLSAANFRTDHLMFPLDSMTSINHPHISPVVNSQFSPRVTRRQSVTNSSQPKWGQVDAYGVDSEGNAAV